MNALSAAATKPRITSPPKGRSIPLNATGRSRVTPPSDDAPRSSLNTPTRISTIDEPIPTAAAS